MLRYETKVVKVYFFAFKLTRKKKTSSQTGTTPYTSLWSKIYIRYANPSPSIPYLKPQLLNVRSRRHRTTTGRHRMPGTPACFRWIQKRLKQEIQPQCPADVQYPHLPKAGTNPTQTVPKNIAQYSAFFHKNHFSIQQVQVSSHSSTVV